MLAICALIAALIAMCLCLENQYRVEDERQKCREVYIDNLHKVTETLLVHEQWMLQQQKALIAQTATEQQ